MIFFHFPKSLNFDMSCLPYQHLYNMYYITHTVYDYELTFMEWVAVAMQLLVTASKPLTTVQDSVLIFVWHH